MTGSMMNSDLAQESVVEEGSVDGFLKIIMKLEDGGEPVAGVGTVGLQVQFPNHLRTGKPQPHSAPF